MAYYNELLKEAQKSQKVLKAIKKDEAQLSIMQRNVDSLTAYGRKSMNQTADRLSHLDPIFDHYLNIEKALLRHQLNYEPARN